ncbi:GTP-binding protein, partial [Patescibacteria group bacterium]|nr:GTP-binding protein [Patescibacteria group bacterium]
MDQKFIRNFCIIAHIDHGKSTLADRFLEFTNTIPERKMKEQVLDSMDLERERGITIKLQPVQMKYKFNGDEYCLNLIDTPGHIDFNYEVSRSLAACEGALLVVDATQGVQAQTVANLYLAIDQGLEIIPIINKIDLPNANIERTTKEIINLIGCKKEEIILASGKTGFGIEKILQNIIEKIPSPNGNTSPDATQALIFDSLYDKYRGAVMYIKIVNGELKKGDIIKLINKNTESEILDIGILHPEMMSTDYLSTGQIGYVVTNIKNISETKVGDTITLLKNTHIQPLHGY